MLVKHSDPMTPEYMKEHCRYKIWQHPSGDLEKASVVAFCDTVKDAKRLIQALGQLDENYSYEYELCADFLQIKDTDMGLGI